MVYERIFSYDELNNDGSSIEVEISEIDIIKKYFDKWKRCWIRKNEGCLIYQDYTYEMCIEDFCVIYGAWENEKKKKNNRSY